MNCILCGESEVTEISRDKNRSYNRCGCCDLIFVPPEFHLSSSEEKAEYDLHENDPGDPGYRQFLNRLFTPMNTHLKPGSHGLDFGSGPGPTLSVMFEESGHTMDLYDKFYSPDPAVFGKPYDFITATEVFEHLHDPGTELDRLWNCLKPGGWLGIMTKLALGPEEFRNWHYKNDMTHVCFYSEKTFKWLANQWHAELIFADKDVILFHKKTE